MSVGRIAAILVASGACNAGEPTSTCGPSTAVVDRVIDGDTIVLASGERVRYLLVDAPEITDGHHDCYGSNARELDSDLVLGKRIELGYDVECTDRYGRLLAYVSVDGVDVNRVMIERGAACVLYLPPDGEDRVDELGRLEAAARDARRGLWGACDPPPCKSKI